MSQIREDNQTSFALPREELGGVGSAFGRLRARTFIATRWLAVVGQTIAVVIVHFGLGYELPVTLCFGAIAASAWLNVFLQLAFPSQRLATTMEAAGQFAFDIIQVAFLISVTGGLFNPFLLMIIAPVTVASMSLGPRLAGGLAGLAFICTALMWELYLPLPLPQDIGPETDNILKLGNFTAITVGLAFFSISAMRVTQDENRLVTALDATQIVLAREQKLSALGAMAAATAHELGTPLATIHLVSKEMLHDLEDDSPWREDATLLVEQAERCRSILKRLAQEREAGDIVHARLKLNSVLEEAARPHKGPDVNVDVRCRPHETAIELDIPTLERKPELIHALSAFIENAVSFAATTVTIEGIYSETYISIFVSDDGPGFSASVLPKLGEPYISERSSAHAGGGDMGLGFFIAKTLVEQTGGQIATFNRRSPEHGAVVRLRWDRLLLEAETTWSAFENELSVDEE